MFHEIHLQASDKRQSKLSSGTAGISKGYCCHQGKWRAKLALELKECLFRISLVAERFVLRRNSSF